MSDFSSDDHDTDYQPPKRDFLSHAANEDSGLRSVIVFIMEKVFYNQSWWLMG